ncbi:GNAT family N-acetyltransferase [Streptomyces sp. cg36]|uniref:GNAT family N-acetyltransferase n=1 Tax=Streptomyces sp. cg36 TaxID=3238798 RepID=UPI0034E2E663
MHGSRWPACPASRTGLIHGLPVGLASGVPGGGVGDHLIRAVERWGAERGATTLRLSVMPDNRKATALYERHGFTDTGEPGDLLPDGGGRERGMAKSLATV